MRVTQSMYYNNIFNSNNSKLNNELFDVNKQIASGLKIQYASDDIRTFTETMRLDNELTTIGQIKKSTESGYKVSNQTDVTMNEFTNSMNRMRTLLIQAANDTNDDTSRDAIAAELRGIEKNLKSLANTSINGSFLFSGSAINTKPISDDGMYHGNDVAISAFVGSNNQQQYNITGAKLFLGEESTVKREVVSNVVNKNLLDGSSLTPDNTIGELMGDKDPAKLNQSHFYVRGTRHDGTTFKNIINLNETATIDDLLKGIENSYASNTVVVSLNGSGQIVVSDKQKGSSKLDFHIVGAVDYNADYTGVPPAPAPNDRAMVTDIDDLDGAVTDYNTATATDFFVQDFSKSNLTSASGAASNIQGLVYDRVAFERTGSILTSNVSQIIRGTHNVQNTGQVTDSITIDKENAFAQDSTLLSEVADTKTEILPATNPKIYTIDGTSFSLSGNNVSGTAFTAQIDLAVAPSTTATFSLDGGTTNYDIFNVDGTQVEPDKMTYRQLMDVMNMITTNQLPATNSATDYHVATDNANYIGNTSLTYDGKIEFKDFTNSTTRASISIYDSNSDDFSANASIMTFNTNNALTVRDPKTDFFKTIDDIIIAVENYSNYPNSDAPDVRNVGIENAIAMMDDLQDHTFRIQAIAGAQSNTLTDALERTSILEISTMSLRSSTIDTDLAESSLRLSQLSLNYEAMLSTVGKVSQLSLVNYL